MDKQNTYPSHLIDPAKKDKDWIARYMRAAWSDYSNSSVEVFYSRRNYYETIRAYAQGKQATNIYKERFDIDSSENKSLLNIDFTPIPIFPKIRTLGLARLNKVDYNVMATPIDPLASEEIEDYFETKKAELLIRQQMEQINPQLVELSPVAKKPGDPEDIDELELQRNYTHKHQMAIEMEQALTVVMEQNKFKKLRAEIKKDIFDWGVGGFKEYIDSNGAIKIKKVDARRLVVSHCQMPDFSDAQHIGEVSEMTISDLKQFAGDQITDKQYEEIENASRGIYGNRAFMPGGSRMNDVSDGNKVRVLDLEFFSVNSSSYEKSTNKYGNTVMSRTNYGKEGKKRRGEYKRVAYKVVYKGKWVLGTNVYFDCGLATDMKRKKSSLMDTTLSYHIASSDFHEMRILGTTERAIPVIDELHIAWYKFQQAIGEARPKGISIEIGALEDLPLGKGGQKLAPMDVLDLYYKKGVVVYRRQDLAGDYTNYRPIEELNNGIGDEAARWFDVVQANVQMLRDITGLNDLTDGSTPDPRTLTTIAEMANESTNNSLWSIVEADNRIFESLCESLVLRIQDVAKAGKLNGYTRSLGNNTVRFISVSPAVSNHEYGIKLENKPDDIQKQKLIQRMEAYVAEGLLQFEDTILIENCDNIKVAEQILAYRIKKRQEQAQQESLQLQEANAQTQIASNAAAEEEKRKSEQFKHQLEMERLMMEKEWDYKIAMLQAQARMGEAQMREEGGMAKEAMRQANEYGN